MAATPSKRISNTKNREYLLLAEVNFKCPLCGKMFLDEKNGSVLKCFELAHIYPHSPTENQKNTLKDVTPPSDVESTKNLIALCHDCHRKYDSDTTTDEYYEMYALKNKLSGRYEAQLELSKVPVENDILKVLKEIEQMPTNDILQLRMDPVSIKEKIPDGVFQGKIISEAMIYYDFLRLQFQDMDAKNTHHFTKIASGFKMAYASAAEKSLLQEDVFEQLVSWLCSKTMGSKAACECVIAYFIQNCEVFDVISK